MPTPSSATITKWRAMTPSQRMAKGVDLVESGDYNISEAARLVNVSRPKLSEKVKKHRERVEAQQARAAATQEERVSAPTILPGQEPPEKQERPVYVSDETRRVPPFQEFDRVYFGHQTCFDCGTTHVAPDFQVEMMDKITDPSIKRLLINVPPGFGKSSTGTVKSTVYELCRDPNALALDTPIPTPTGWTTMGEVKPGDIVFDRLGRQTRVVAKSPVFTDHQCYRMVLSDGSEFIADAGHRWWVQHFDRRNAPKFMTTEELAAAGRKAGNNFRYSIVNQPGLDLPDADLPIDPYVLGVWLGDGTAKDGTIASHPDDQPEVRAAFELAGIPTTDQSFRMTFGTLGLKAKLRDLGVLRNKHVPAVYMRGSHKQRLALLQGLMDTDGCASKDGKATFSNTNELLVDAVAELAASLGYKPSRQKVRRSHMSTMDQHTVYFLPTADINPFRMSRKADRITRTSRNAWSARRIVSIEPVETQDVQCLTVDSDTHTFLAGKMMVPTGNSLTAIVSKSEKLASKFLYLIGRYLTEPSMYEGAERNLIDDWGPFKTGNEPWNGKQIYVGRQSAEKDPSVSAYGVGGHIYGIRAHRMIMDDVADLENQANADRVTEMLKWCTQEAGSRVGRHGKLIFIGTRVSSGDIYSQLQALPGYHVIRYSCIQDDATEMTLWPEHFPYAAADLQRQSMTSEQWQLVYQNVDVPGFGASFPPEVVEACRDQERSFGHCDSEWQLVCGLDLAGTGAQAGYTAFNLWGLDMRTGKIHLVDYVNVKQMKAPQIKEQILDWADRYPNLRELRVEVNGLQGQIVQYNEEIMQKLAMKGIRVVPHITSHRNKFDPQFGVEAMAPLFYNRVISTPAASVGDRNRLRVWEEQFEQFPMGRHSDLVMSAWFAYLGIRELQQRAISPMFDPRMKLPHRISRKRGVIDFGEGKILPPPDTSTQLGRPAFMTGYEPELKKLVNMQGSVKVY